MYLHSRALSEELHRIVILVTPFADLQRTPTPVWIDIAKAKSCGVCGIFMCSTARVRPFQTALIVQKQRQICMQKSGRVVFSYLNVRNMRVYLRVFVRAWLFACVCVFLCALQ